MRPVSAMSRNESEMVNKSKRFLASGRVEDSVDKLRHLCLARGKMLMTKKLFTD